MAQRTGSGDPGWGRWLDLTRETWTAQSRWGRESLDLARSALGGELDPAGAGRAYLDATRREAEHFLRTASRLGAEYARDLMLLSSDVASTVLHDVAASRHSRGGQAARNAASSQPTAWAQDPSGTTVPAPATSAQPPAPAQVELRGPLGGVARARVTVVNRHPRPRRIQLTAGPVTDVAGTVVDDLEISVEPARVTVAAGEEAEVMLEIALPAEVVSVGATYRCRVEVSGGDEAVLDCTVAVSAP